MKKQHLEAATNQEAERSIKRLIKFLDQEVERLEKKINELITSDTVLKEKVDRLTTVKGIGPIVALTNRLICQSLAH